MDGKLSYCVSNDCLIFRFVLLRCGTLFLTTYNFAVK